MVGGTGLGEGVGINSAEGVGSSMIGKSRLGSSIWAIKKMTPAITAKTRATLRAR
jgi:hypothetical protein